MKDQSSLLKKCFAKKEFWILKLYEYLNKEFINSYYRLDGNEIKFFWKYFKSGNKDMVKTLWHEKSIQREIFLFSEKIYEYLNSNQQNSKIDFCKIIESDFKEFILKEKLISYYDKIQYYFSILQEEDELKYYNYKDNNFIVFYLKNVTKIKLNEIYSNKDRAFYIIFNGLIKYQNKLYGERDIIYSNVSSLEKDFKVLTPTCSIIVFIIKNNFFYNNNLDLIGDSIGSFKSYYPELFNLILLKKEINSSNYLVLFQIATYLYEKLKLEKIETLSISELKYKKTIIDLVKTNILLPEKEILELLLERLDISLSKLYKIFSNLFFTTPHKYISSIKVLNSCILLSNTNEQLENISYQLGYSSKTFREIFLANTGYSPTDFRNLTKEHSNKNIKMGRE